MTLSKLCFYKTNFDSNYNVTQRAYIIVEGMFYLILSTVKTQFKSEAKLFKQLSAASWGTKNRTWELTEA